jgi:hypothetical protein
MPKTFWVYLVFMFVGCVGAMAWQFSHRAHNVDLYQYRGQYLTRRYLDYKKMREKSPGPEEAQLAELDGQDDSMQ